MKIEDYNKYCIQGSDHYLIPKDVFKELFNEMINWKEENKTLKNELKNKPDTEITLQDDKGNKFMLIQTERIDMQVELNKTIEKLFNNWNKLKELAINSLDFYKGTDSKYIKTQREFGIREAYRIILGKMQEIEGNDSNDSN